MCELFSRGGRGCCVRVTGAYKQGCRRRVRLLIHACFKLHYIMNLFHSHRVVTKLIFPLDIIAPLFPIPLSSSLSFLSIFLLYRLLIIPYCCLAEFCLLQSGLLLSASYDSTNRTHPLVGHDNSDSCTQFLSCFLFYCTNHTSTSSY